MARIRILSLVDNTVLGADDVAHGVKVDPRRLPILYALAELPPRAFGYVVGAELRVYDPAGLLTCDDRAALDDLAALVRAFVEELTREFPDAKRTFGLSDDATRPV